MATTSGAMPGDTTAGARTVPCGDAISTTSPSPTPSLAAVAGLISTQLLHIADVIGSGSSCSHGTCASEPSRNADDMYGCRYIGYCCASPSNFGSSHVNELGDGAIGVCAAAIAAGAVPHHPPLSCASVHASEFADAPGSFMNSAVSISSKVCHGKSSGRAS